MIARKRDRSPMTSREIAFISGITVERIARISRLPSFATVPIGEAELFRLGCGVTRENERRHCYYLKRTRMWAKKPLAHLDRLPAGQKKQLARLFK